MASTGVFRIAIAGIRTRAAGIPTASSSFSPISLPSRLRSSSHRGFASSTAAFSAAPSTSSIPAVNAAATSSAETAAATTQAVVEPEVVSGGFEFLEPWVPTIHNLAETLHFTGPHAHALAIFVLAFAVRTAVTLPVTLWQRSKTRKLTEQVLPEWEIMKEQIPLQVRANCRRAGMSYEAFHKEAQKEVGFAVH